MIFMKGLLSALVCSCSLSSTEKAATFIGMVQKREGRIRDPPLSPLNKQQAGTRTVIPQQTHTHTCLMHTPSQGNTHFILRITHTQAHTHNLHARNTHTRNSYARKTHRYKGYCSSSDFIREHIFPGGHLPSVGAMVEAARGTGLGLHTTTDIGEVNV